MRKQTALIMLLAAFSCASAFSSDGEILKCDDKVVEPSAQLANLWWAPQRNVWTPIGWKDHVFRFNVVYNGTVVAMPHVRDAKKYTKQYQGLGTTLEFIPSLDGDPGKEMGPQPFQLCSRPDGGVGNQGWLDNETPVLWTQWRLSTPGIVLRQEIFGHITSGKPVERGDEPLYAWIKLKVERVDNLLTPPDKIHFLIRINSDNTISRTMNQDENLTYHPEQRFYPRQLQASAVNGGIELTEQDGLIRLMGLANKEVSYEFMQRPSRIEGKHDDFLKVTLAAAKDAEAILLLPMLPQKREVIEKELAIGRDEALKQSDKYWSERPATAAIIETPEQQLNDAINHGIKLAQVIAEKNPETGEYSILSGSWQYDMLWSTSASMVSHMFLDPLGYHDTVEKYIEIYYRHQGTVVPPGPAFSLHPGYFSSPKSLTAIDWLCDHGAILYLLSNHALLSGDKDFTDKWLGHVIKGCEFIKDARRMTNHNGIKGIMPPGVATDSKVPVQVMWTDGWNYKGLTTAVRLLKRIGHPRAKEFEAEAAAYKTAFVKGMRDVTQTMPTWTDDSGKSHHYIPYALSEDTRKSDAGQYRTIAHPFYLDTGPLIIVWSGLMDADDPIMRDAAKFFRSGPNTELRDERLRWNQRAALIHEMSSAEPHYSWNIYHSRQLGDRYRYLEGMYSVLVGAISPQTFANGETRHGIYGRVCAIPFVTTLARLSVIDDTLAEDELHLLRLVPKAWLTSDKLTRFENMPTEYGTVTLNFKLNEKKTALDVTFKPDWRYEPKKVLLYTPPIDTLKEVIINGKNYKSKPGQTQLIND